jgi:hypothetical protein
MNVDDPRQLGGAHATCTQGRILIHINIPIRELGRLRR